MLLQQAAGPVVGATSSEREQSFKNVSERDQHSIQQMQCLLRMIKYIHIMCNPNISDNFLWNKTHHLTKINCSSVSLSQWLKHHS